MRNLPTTPLQLFCPPTWVAKAYSEYLLDCANETSKLIECILRYAADDDISTSVDAVSSSYTSALISIKTDLLDGVLKARILQLPGTENDPMRYAPQIDASQLNQLNWDDPMMMDIVQVFLAHATADQYPTVHDNIDTLRNLNSTWAATYDGYISEYRYDLAAQMICDIMYDNSYAATCDSVASVIDTAKTSFLSELMIQESTPYTLDEGWVTAGELFEKMVLNINLADNGSFTIVVKDINGDDLESVVYNSEDIFEQMKASFSSAIGWGLGFAAMAYENISEQMAYFNSQVSTFVSDTTEKFANTINVVRAKIADAKNSVSNFFSIAAEDLGFNDINNDVFTTVDSSDVYSYTGASPLASVNLKGAKTVASVAISAVVAVGASIFGAAKSLLTKAADKVKPYFKAITNDPVDIGVVDDKDLSYACTNFKAHTTEYIEDQNQIGYGHANFSTNQSSASMFRQVISGLLDQWIAIDTYFGEVLFRFRDYEIDHDHQEYDVDFTYDLVYRPKCLNYREAVNTELVYRRNPASDPLTSQERIATISMREGTTDLWYNYICGNYRPSSDEDEKWLYMGFWLSSALMYGLGASVANQLREWCALENGFVNNDWSINVPGRNISFNFEPSPLNYRAGPWLADTSSRYVPEHVSNLDFIKMTSGYRQYESSGITYNLFDAFPCCPNSFEPETPITNSTFVSIQEICFGFILAFLYQQIDKRAHPNEYLFLPYCRNSFSFSDGRYKIKTDAENQNLANLIVNALVVILVVVATFAICKGLLKLFKTKKYARLSAKVGVMDNAMWNGKKLSTTEAFQYRRWKKKLEKLENGSSGLSGSGSKLSSIYSGIKNLQGSMLPVDDNVPNYASEDSSMSIDRVYGIIKGD